MENLEVSKLRVNIKRGKQMKAIELLQYLKDGMDTGYPPKHIINNAIKEIEDLEESNKELLECLIATQEKLEGIIK